MLKMRNAFFFFFFFQLRSRTVELLQIFLLILEKFYFWVKTVSMFEIPFEQVSLLSEREFIIALNSSNFSADWKTKSAQLSPLVAPHKESDEADPYLCILLVCRHYFLLSHHFSGKIMGESKHFQAMM